MSGKFVLVLALMLAACGVSSEGGMPQRESANKEDFFGIESSLGTFAGIHVGMAEDDLLSLGYPVSHRSVVLEGDEYAIVDVTIKEDVNVECLLDSGRVEKFSVTANSVRDENAVGVGSKLSELRHAYPQGRLLVGDEDGRYANFVNGSRVVFELDQEGIDLRCFESPGVSCDIDPDTEVVRVVVNAGPAG